MNKWKELKIGDIPKDIFTVQYDFEMFDREKREYLKCNWDIFAIIAHMRLPEPLYSFAYVKKEPKAPTHEEIMTKWWKINIQEWARCDLYCKEGTDRYGISGNYENVSWFTGRESADIPPEAE